MARLPVFLSRLVLAYISDERRAVNLIMIQITTPDLSPRHPCWSTLLFVDKWQHSPEIMKESNQNERSHLRIQLGSAQPRKHVGSSWSGNGVLWTCIVCERYRVSTNMAADQQSLPCSYQKGFGQDHEWGMRHEAWGMRQEARGKRQDVRAAALVTAIA